MPKEKIALITGATSGIGKELAKIHASMGGHLVLVARRKAYLEELKIQLEKQYGNRIITISKDLSKDGSVLEVYQEVKKAGITVDYLINNAGFGGHGKFYDRNWEEDSAMIHLNILALSELTRRFLPDFIERDAGKILNVSSTASLLPGPLQAVYFATKAYVTSFSNALSEELRHTSITVTNLMPGATETEFAKVAGLENTKLFASTFPADVVARRGYDGMLKGKIDVIAGVSFAQQILMKLLPFVPKKWMLKQAHQLQEVMK